MRPAALMKRRPANDSGSTTPAAATDPSVDPPIVQTLVQPLLDLRASLGSGVGVPDEAVATALSNASAQAADTERPHRDGMHGLESTWTGPAADAAVPTLRTTQTRIGEISDRGPAYLSLLADAQATSARAARKVDRIIEDFRRDARTILGNATAAPDTDAVITRATQALREAIKTVQAAQTEMDDHTQRLSEMEPLTVTTPTGAAPTWNGTGQYGVGGTATNQYGAPGTTQPMDPALAAQLQLQQQLIQAGVQVGTAAINAGVDIGTHLIDKIAEVGTHAMDTVAASVNNVVDTAVPELIRPGSTTGGDGSTGSKIFDFGGNQPSGQSSPSTPGVVIPPAPNAAPAPNNSSAPAPSASGPGANPAKPEVRPEPAPQPPASTAPPAPEPPPPAAAAPPAPDQSGHGGGVAGGMAMPPPQANNDQDHKPREGQLGVTVPAAVAEEETVPAAVIGDFGDDTL
ncbi:hypothetical protein [Nocardia transvalensis]|uniref:hypothetical protein n=1 Tax=Nocardia transvalensis TaxID=37333 RepID=UPI0018937E82|nr:hypothetical protein [Nocardia transvalensis]MBF6327456.1 hypothetical protein [Nocardia transvalensis]